MAKDGLFRKYVITKADGSPVDPAAKYFVLRMDTDRAACIAAQAYAGSIASDNPKLATELLAEAQRCLRNIRGPQNPREQKKKEPKKRKTDSPVIAECIVEAGYGTESYDPDSGECYHQSYASMVEVVSNPAYWKQYEEAMSTPLNHDFGLGFNFLTYRLRVYADGTREAEKVEGRTGQRKGCRSTARDNADGTW